MSFGRKDGRNMAGIFQKKRALPFVSAVIAAGGSSQRMGENKLLLELEGMPVLARTLAAFEACDMVREVILVAKSELVVEYSQLSIDFGMKKVTKVVAGGKNRAESVLRGVREVNENCEYICVHDAARPLVLPEEIERVCAAAFEQVAAVAVAPIRDTVKRVLDGRIRDTVDRETLRAAQTPQVAEAKLLEGALIRALTAGDAPTDDSGALEVMGVRPVAVACSPCNIKLTTPEDLVFAAAVVAAREDV